MEDRSSPDSETRGVIGHQSLTLGSAHLGSCQREKSLRSKKRECTPELQRFVFPLLQNLHSWHSAMYRGMT